MKLGLNMNFKDSELVAYEVKPTENPGEYQFNIMLGFACEIMVYKTKTEEEFRSVQNRLDELLDESDM